MSSDSSDSIPLRSRLYVGTSESEDIEQSSEHSSEYVDYVSDVGDSIEVRAPPPAEPGLYDLLNQEWSCEWSCELPPGSSEDGIRGVVLAARSLGTVDGVLTVAETNSRLVGDTLPMTLFEQNELVRLLTSYYVGYTERPTRNGPGYGIMVCRSYTTDATYTVVCDLPDEPSDCDDDSDTDEFDGSDAWGDTSGTDERSTQVAHLSARLGELVRRRTEAQRSKEDVVSDDDEEEE